MKRLMFAFWLSLLPKRLILVIAAALLPSVAQAQSYQEQLNDRMVRSSELISQQLRQINQQMSSFDARLRALENRSSAPTYTASRYTPAPSYRPSYTPPDTYQTSYAPSGYKQQPCGCPAGGRVMVTRIPGTNCYRVCIVEAEDADDD